MARQVLRWTPETTWGTYSAVNPSALIQLDQNNQFTLRKKPIEWVIRSAGANNRRVQTGSSKYGIGGALNMVLYDTQVATIAPALFASSGNTLGSVTFDHFAVMEDGTPTKWYGRYLGCMFPQVGISAKESDQLWRLSLQIVGKDFDTITNTDLPEPAATDYPSGNPYVFEHFGPFTFGTSRAEFEEFSLNIKNIIDVRFMRSATPMRMRYCGRDVDFNVRFPWITTADRAALEAKTPRAASVTATNGANSIAFQFNSKNYTADVVDDLDENKVFMQGVSGQCYFDPTAGTPNDLLVTVV